VNSNRGSGITRTSECLEAGTEASHFQRCTMTVHTSDFYCAVFGLEAYLLPCVFLRAKDYAKMYSQNALKSVTQIVVR